VSAGIKGIKAGSGTIVADGFGRQDAKTIADKATAVRVNVELPEGAIQLEAVKGMGFNDELIGMLKQAAASN